MKRVKCKVTYESVLWMADREYEDVKEQADTGEIEKEMKGSLDDILLEDKRNESSKITNFYSGVDKEW